MAERAGVSYAQAQKMRYNMGGVTIETLEQVCSALDLDALDILGWPRPDDGVHDLLAETLQRDEPDALKAVVGVLYRQRDIARQVANDQEVGSTARACAAAMASLLDKALTGQWL